MLGRTHRKGALYLSLTLPDGGSSLIPAEWTDLNANSYSQSNFHCATHLLARLQDLMHTRKVVDALLQRLDTLHTCPAQQEDPHADGTISHTFTAVDNTTDLGTSQQRAESNNRHHPCAADEKNHATRTKEKHT